MIAMVICGMTIVLMDATALLVGLVSTAVEIRALCMQSIDHNKYSARLPNTLWGADSSSFLTRGAPWSFPK